MCDLGRDKGPVRCAVCQVAAGTIGVTGEICGGFYLKSMFMNQNSKCILLAILFLRLPGVRKTLSRSKAFANSITDNEISSSGSL